MGSTSTVLSASGTVEQQQKYYPFGGVRSGSVTLTDKQFTGQQKESSMWGEMFGLYDYGARFYSTLPGQFMSADPLVPGTGALTANLAVRYPVSGQEQVNPQALDRYSYVLNNPLHYTDPTGYTWMSGSGDGSSVQAFYSMLQGLLNLGLSSGAIDSLLNTGEYGGITLTDWTALSPLADVFLAAGMPLDQIPQAIMDLAVAVQALQAAPPADVSQSNWARDFAALINTDPNTPDWFNSFQSLLTTGTIPEYLLFNVHDVAAGVMVMAFGVAFVGVAYESTAMLWAVPPVGAIATAGYLAAAGFIWAGAGAGFFGAEWAGWQIITSSAEPYPR